MAPSVASSLLFTWELFHRTSATTVLLSAKVIQSSGFNTKAKISRMDTKYQQLKLLYKMLNKHYAGFVHHTLFHHESHVGL